MIGENRIFDQIFFFEQFFGQLAVSWYRNWTKKEISNTNKNTIFC